jgi:GAF domain-containing protein
VEARAAGGAADEPTPSTSLPDEQRLERGIRELAAMLLNETTVEGMLESVTTLATTAIPGCDAASVSLLRRGRLATQAASGDAAADLDRAQYTTRKGPCLDAVHHGEVVGVDSFATDGRWPEVAARAAARGVASSISVPLAVADEVLGSLNLYSQEAGAFTDTHGQACMLGRQASITLANALALQRAELLARQLSQALENRDVIGQAKGIIMAGENVSPDQAFDVLRRASQRANRKLRDVAGDIVDRRNGDHAPLDHTSVGPAEPAPADPAPAGHAGLAG